MWLSDTHGHLVDWVTQRWVRLTGRAISLADEPWLAGPVGRPTGIGATFFDEYAQEHALVVRRGERQGLLERLGSLQSATCDPHRIAPAVAAFYTDTTNYELDAWAEWTGLVRPGGWLLARLFSRRLQQLNVPLSALDTSHGMTSDIVGVFEPSTGRKIFTAWVRRLLRTGNVIYSGAYSTCVVPDDATPCVRVVFPLPNGNAMVLMNRAWPVMARCYWNQQDEASAARDSTSQSWMALGESGRGTCEPCENGFMCIRQRIMSGPTTSCHSGA